MCGTPVGAYYDDLALVDLQGAQNTGRKALHTVFNLCKAPPSADKGQPLAKFFRHLGAYSTVFKARAEGIVEMEAK